MNGGTGLMTVRMYNDEKYRIIPTTIHSGGSIGMHRQTSGDDMNYILSGMMRDTQFPKDLERAYELGKRLVNAAK